MDCWHLALAPEGRVTAKAKRAKRLTKVQELTARVESLGKQLLEVQNSYVEERRKLEAQRLAFDVEQRCFRAIIVVQREQLHTALGYVEPSCSDTCAPEPKRSWLDRVPPQTFGFAK